ncbi:MAG: hypothetical protein IK062_02345 [Selenomonadaceae bacterium]|nr:hypothetical protein [Selenomonadaceae bacterium]
MKQLSLKNLEKSLEKKNAELIEVREFRKKLDDKEKEICAAIDKLQNQKVDVIFAQVKKEIKNNNLDISSASVLTIVDALKNNQQILNTEENSESETQNEKILSTEKSELEIKDEKILSDEKTEFETPMTNDDDFFKKINSLSDKNETDSE